MKNIIEVDKEGFAREINCPLCMVKIGCYAVTCDETPNYAEFKCEKHGEIRVFQNGQMITLFDELKQNCIYYISLLNVNSAGIERVRCHEEIAQALGRKHHDIELKEITDNLDEQIGLPLNEMADPSRFGIKLYNLFVRKFVK